MGFPLRGNCWMFGTLKQAAEDQFYCIWYVKPTGSGRIPMQNVVGFLDHTASLPENSGNRSLPIPSFLTAEGGSSNPGIPKTLLFQVLFGTRRHCCLKDLKLQAKIGRNHLFGLQQLELVFFVWCGRYVYLISQAVADETIAEEARPATGGWHKKWSDQRRWYQSFIRVGVAYNQPQEEHIYVLLLLSCEAKLFVFPSFCDWDEEKVRWQPPTSLSKAAPHNISLRFCSKYINEYG